ncbi:NUDIX domain-containing protein [Nocardia sp. NPDC057353]|uniref:NUDIX hydrolase n=1 Tax=Nocardia sp. NPDC057353 TaxID=3346104 RepID=UPI003641CE8A
MTQLIDTVAWILVREGRVLCARPRGKDVFYVPGGKREAGESDEQTLLREITEELTVALLPGSLRHVGTYEAVDGPVLVRMACYTAEYRGTITASAEIAELAWFRYADRPLVPPVDQLLFDDLAAEGGLR